MCIQYSAINTKIQELEAWIGQPESEDRGQTETAGGASRQGVNLGHTAEPQLRTPGMPEGVPVGTAT